MWNEIERLVKDSCCRLSVYADDLTISGENVPERLIWDIKRTLFRHGHRYNPSKEGSKRLKPAEITGVILSRDRLLAPNRQHQKLHGIRQELKLARSAERRKQLEAQAKGREAQFWQIVGVTAPNKSD